MSSNHVNVIKSFDYTWTYEASADSDEVKSQLKYVDKFSGWASRCPKFGSEHPDLPAMLLTQVRADRQPGDVIAVTLNYKSRTSDVEYPGKQIGDPIPRYSVRISGGEEHILSSPYAEDLDVDEQKALLAISNGSEVDDAGVKWDTLVTTELGLSILAKIRKGNVSYKTGSLIYTERKLITSLSSLDYTDIGKISVPPGPVGGNPNSWIYDSASAEPDETGLTWNMERNWAFSPNGWDTDLYTAL